MTTYYVLEYRDTRNRTRTRRYFRERYLLNDYVNKHEYFIEGAKYGTKEV